MIAPSLAVAAHLPYALAGVWKGLAPIGGGIAVGAAFTKLVELPALKVRDRLFPRRLDSPVGIPAEVECAEGRRNHQKQTATGEAPAASWEAVISGQS